MKTKQSIKASFLTLVVICAILGRPLQMLALGSDRTAVCVVNPLTSSESNDSIDKLSFNPQIQMTAAAINKWLSASLKNELPDSELDRKKYETVVRLVLDEKGGVKNFNILTTPSLEFNEKLAGILTKAPNFGKLNTNGTAARVTYVVPITFILR